MASVPDMVKKQPTRIAVLFPGQGSQVVGMLSELAETYPEIRDTFTEASTALGEDLWVICQDEDKLNQTQYTQPALLTASIAIWRILQQKIEDKPCYLAGHSLGEYSALCAAGVISLADAVKLVHKRGQLMQEAVAGVDTAMAAVLGLEDHRVENLCEQATEHVDDAIVGAANFNSPGQVVVSGNAGSTSASGARLESIKDSFIAWICWAVSCRRGGGISGLGALGVEQDLRSLAHRENPRRTWPKRLNTCNTLLCGLGGGGAIHGFSLSCDPRVIKLHSGRDSALFPVLDALNTAFSQGEAQALCQLGSAA